MWAWLAAGWVAASLLIAIVHHRWRRRHGTAGPEVAAFLVRFENELVASQPGIAFLGMLPGRFACLLCVDGQETVVSLHPLLHHERSGRDAFTRAVASLVAEIREVGLDRIGDRDFAAAAPLLMPQVRSRSWLEARGAFGDSGLVHSPLADHLVTVYVLDEPDAMVFVCREHLRRWRKDIAAVHNLALQNLARRGGSVPTAAGSPMILQTGDGFDAARVLLLDARDGLLVAIPDRDTLWVGSECGQDLGRLMSSAAAVAAAAAHPVSPQVYRLRAGRLETLSGSR